MGKVVILMGKSASGKDTIYNLLQQEKDLALQQIIPYTTRPMRNGEAEGQTYHFVTEEQFNLLSEQGRVIEYRSYHTVYGIWTYFTVADAIDLSKHDYLMIGTLEAYTSIVAHFGQENIIPVFIYVEDGLRLERAMAREKVQKTPKYEEMCRRFLADSVDYAPEKLKEAGITKVFENNDSEQVCKEISAYIKTQLLR